MQKRVVASAQTLLRLIGPDVLHCAPLRHTMLARNGPKSLQQVSVLVTKKHAGILFLSQNVKSGHLHEQGAYAVFEDMLQRSKSAPPPLAGPDLARLMRVGTRVVRGADWKWDDQGRC